MLDQQRAELEKLGYAILSQTDDEIIAVRRKWFWDCIATNLTMVLFVQAVETLTAARIEADAARMIARAKEADPSSLPLGFQHGRAVVLVYLAGRVEPDAQLLCSSSQKMRFSVMFFPAALDQSSGRAYYLRSTPFWGSLYFGKLRYPVQRLLEPAAAPEHEPASVYGIVLGVFMLALFIAVVCGCLGSSLLTLLSTIQNIH